MTMNNSNHNKVNELRIEAGSCFFIFWKKHDHSESLTAVYTEYLLLLRLILLIHLVRQNAQESTGNRIKKTSKTSGVVVYSFDGLYEIARTPGEGDKHTLYFKGLHGDLFSQMTRNDAALITDASSGSKSSNFLEFAGLSGVFPFAKGDVFPPDLNGVAANDKEAVIEALEMTTSAMSFFCENIAGSCSDYYVNTAKYYYVQGVFKVARVIYSVEYDVFVWLMLVLVLYGIYLVSNKKVSFEQRAVIEPVEMTTSGIGRSIVTSRASVTGFFNTLHDSWFAKRTLSITPLLTVAILFTFTNCGIFGGGKKKGDAPWLLLASGVNANTPSVDDASNSSGTGASGGGSGGSALVPVVGMYFLHPDHLGSITMITDGRGNVIAGGNNGGKSHISYTPYGSIHRTDSSGPDITRFKYTGQEEDKESGLMYYKARYYDPMIGRFLQADSVVVPESTFGMNRYMYVEGNPVRYRDASGHNKNNPALGALIGYVLGPQIGIGQNEGAALGAGIGMGNKGKNSNIGKNIGDGAKLIGRNTDHGSKWAAKNVKALGDPYMAGVLIGIAIFQNSKDAFTQVIGIGLALSILFHRAYNARDRRRSQSIGYLDKLKFKPLGDAKLVFTSDQDDSADARNVFILWGLTQFQGQSGQTKDESGSGQPPKPPEISGNGGTL